MRFSTEFGDVQPECVPRDFPQKRRLDHFSVHETAEMIQAFDLSRLRTGKPVPLFQEPLRAVSRAPGLLSWLPDAATQFSHQDRVKLRRRLLIIG